jgi:hypothetical protein
MLGKLTKTNAPVELSEQELDAVAGGTHKKKPIYIFEPKPPVICGFGEDGLDPCTGQRIGIPPGTVS